MREYKLKELLQKYFTGPATESVRNLVDEKYDYIEFTGKIAFDQKQLIRAEWKRELNLRTKSTRRIKLFSPRSQVAASIILIVFASLWYKIFNKFQQIDITQKS